MTTTVGARSGGDRPLATPLFASATPGPGPTLDLPRRRFDFEREVVIMGIVNVTPDSFYDRGATYDRGAAIARALTLAEEGATIVDIGGVKGGPGADVATAEEIERVVPIVEALRAVDDDTVLSVDTYRAEVADAALAAGADLINDVTGAHDDRILGTVAAHDAGYIAVHHGGEPRTRPFRRGYWPDVTTAVVRHCRELTDRAIDRGVDRRRLVVDPGHDLQKTTYHSLELSRRLPELASLGFPVLVALSNKDFVGEVLDVALHERIDGSLAAAVFSILRGANIVRVHEVERTLHAVRTVEALLGWRGPAVAVRGLE